MDARFCNDYGADGFSWLAGESRTRTSHALVADGRVWLVDPVEWGDALDRVDEAGSPAAVLQLFDQHNRDCAAIAARLGVPHLIAPRMLPDSPFDVIEVRRTRRWLESALWWPATGTLVVAEAVGTNPFFTGGRGAAGVHVLMRLRPPSSALGTFAPERLLVGHGHGLTGADAVEGLRYALGHARTGLPRVLLKLPGLLLAARRQGSR